MIPALDRTRALLDTPAPDPIPGQLAAPLGPRIGSVCSGYRGLDAAVEAVFGGTTAWVSDIDPGANRILATTGPTSPTTGTSPPPTGPPSNPSKSTAAATPASPSATPASEKEPTMTATSGRGLPIPLGFYDPESQSLKTSRVTFDSDSTPSSPTLPASGSMRSGALYARTRSALPTSDAASSSSPLLKTPTANLAINGGSQHPDKRKQGGHGPTLADEVEHLLPTPTATPYGNNQSDSPGAAVRPSLNSLAPTLLPTPTASFPGTTANFRPDGTPYREGYGPTLLDAARLLLPTPTASDGDRAILTYGRGNPTLRGAVSNPPSADGNTPSDDGPPGQLTIDIA